MENVRTKVSRNTSDSKSLKSTIPEAVTNALKIAQGDFLDWDLEVVDGKLIVIVKKVEKV
jgi:uncharacterized membrane protein YkoI